MEYLLDSVTSAIKLIFAFDASVFIVVWTSIRISAIAVTLASLFSIPMALLVALNTFPGKPLLLQTLNTLLALPTVVVGLLLYGLLSRQGPMGELGLLYTPTAMIIGQCVLVIPVIWSLGISAASSADPRLSKTCMALGANSVQQGLLFLNEVRFSIMAAVVMGFGRAIGEVGIAMMLGGNIEGFTRTMTTAIAMETSKGEFEFALALGILLLLVAFVINGLLQRFQYLNK
jgi:tungstate transport system permease protein